MSLVIRLILALVWLGASAGKLGRVEELADIIVAYRVVPELLVVPMATILPSLELVLGLSLLMGFLTESAALLSAFLSAGFGVAIGQALWRNIDTACGCFSLDPSGAVVSKAHLLGDLILLGASLWLLNAGRNSPWDLDRFLVEETQDPTAEEFCHGES